MKKTVVYFLLLVALATFSCKPSVNYGEPVVPPAAILKDIMSFLIYRQQHLRLAEDFTAIDQSSSVIDHEMFFKQLASGNFLPLRLTSKDSSAYYQLYPFDAARYEDLQITLRQWGEHLYALHQMEGKELPAFAFTDLAGKTYTKENTKGKIVVVKGWFIGCVPCVKEMPALNKLVKEYSNREDVVFVSLAFDNERQLRSFLKQFPFAYAVVPNQQTYLLETLNVNEFPTHILLNKQGRIVKVVNDHQELAVALQKEVATQKL
jgi:thiol-disulfide isomerase/thioredoxin